MEKIHGPKKQLECLLNKHLLLCACLLMETDLKNLLKSAMR